MSKILRLLKLTPEAYEEMFTGAYLRWCMDFSINYENDLQKLVANASLNNYYCTEYRKCEAEFLRLVSAYEGSKEVTHTDILELYNDCTFAMFNRFSKPLIERAKKTNIVQQFNAS